MNKMKQKFVIGLIIIALCCLEASAQVQFRKPLKTNNKEKTDLSDYNIGIKMGCPWSFMPIWDHKDQIYIGNFGYLVGFFGERHFDNWSVALEISFAQKGNKIRINKPYQTNFHDIEHILIPADSIAYNVVSLRIPFIYYITPFYFNHHGKSKNGSTLPYIFAGPEIDISLPFNIDLVPFAIDAADNRGKNVPYYNLSAVVGLGLMNTVDINHVTFFLKFEAAFNCGIINLHADTFKNALMWPFQDQKKRIFAHDVEICFSFVYPIKRILRDAGYYFK